MAELTKETSDTILPSRGSIFSPGEVGGGITNSLPLLFPGNVSGVAANISSSAPLLLGTGGEQHKQATAANTATLMDSPFTPVVTVKGDMAAPFNSQPVCGTGQANLDGSNCIIQGFPTTPYYS